MGKLKQFDVVFANNQNAFYPGQVISGTVVLELDEPVTARAVRLLLNGQAYVHWSEQHGSGDHRHTVHYSDRETYMNHSITLWGKQEGDRSADNPELPVGMHSFAFSFPLPTNIPSSFETYSGHIRYWVTGQVDRPWKFDFKSKRPFTVIEYIDINRQDLLIPMRSETQKHLCCLCCKSGPISLSASIDRVGYCPGESVIISADAENQSNRELKGIRAQLIASVTLFAHGHRHYHRQVVAELQGERLMPHGTSQWTNKAFPLPPTAPSIKSCRILDLTHYIQVCVVIPRGINLKIHFPILLGTVPRSTALQIAQQNPTFIQTANQAESFLPPAAVLNSPANPFVPTAPPPYSEATGETFNIADQDDAHTFGNLQYAPAYPFVGAQPLPPSTQAAYPPPVSAPNPAPNPPAPYPPAQPPYPVDVGFSGGAAAFSGAPYPPPDGGEQMPLQPMNQEAGPLPPKNPY
eukprot:m.175370 g.175370  ORF g.175370 m.175370 type:complete len:464 (+) comp39127_c0_seq2:268-1659(+)